MPSARLLKFQEAAAKIPATGRGRGGAAVAAAGGDAPGGGRGEAAVPSELYEKILHDPKFRDPRGYIMPSDQPDFATATKFVNSLLKNGLTVLKASASFEVAGKKYPAGSYIVKSNQAFRPMVREM